VNYVFGKGKKASGTSSSDAPLPKIVGLNWNPNTILVEAFIRAARRIKTMLRVSLAMEIIITMTWNIWTERNSDPTVTNCLNIFKREFSLVILPAKERHADNMKSWLLNIQQCCGISSFAFVLLSYSSFLFCFLTICTDNDDNSRSSGGVI
jgi:hypothetical protein